MEPPSAANNMSFDELHSHNLTGAIAAIRNLTMFTTTANNNNSNNISNNNTGTKPDQPLSLMVNPSEFMLLFLILQVIGLLELVIGLFSNLTAFAVLCRKTYRASSTAVYLRALAVFDFFVLATISVSEALIKTVLTTKWLCFLFDYALLVFINCSNWTLVLITIERMLAILLPHHVSRIMTKRTANTAIVILVICMMLIDSHDFFFYSEAGWDRCQFYYTTEPAKTVIRVFKIIHTLKFVLIPLPVIVIGNIVIITHLRRQKELMKMARANVPTTDKTHTNVNTKNSVKNPLHTVEISISKISSPTKFEKTEVTTVASSKAERCKKEESRGKVHIPRKVTEPSWKVMRKDRDRGLTVTLLALNVSYLVARLPFEIHNMTLGIPPQDNMTSTDFVTRRIMGTFSLLNNTINVFLYFATGSRFRNEFKAMIKEIWTKLRTCFCW